MALLDPKVWKATKKWHKGDVCEAIIELVKDNKMDRFDLDFIISTEIVAPTVATVHSGRGR